MKKKLNAVLLVDDDEDNNYIHNLVLTEAGCAENILVAYDGKEALDILTSNIKEKQPNPEIIFLDLNMPRMNGWEFLDEYKKLDKKEREKIVLLVLTTSLNPDDRARALKYADVKGYYNKFLDYEKINQILTQHFPAIEPSKIKF